MIDQPSERNVFTSETGDDKGVIEQKEAHF